MAESLRSQKMNMTEGPVLGKMIRFTIPVMASGILQLLFNAADVAVVGDFAGVMGLLMALCWTQAVMLLITSVCFLKGMGP